MTDIIHMTTVHPRTDTRIRVKEVTTLAQALDVTIALYVQDGQGDEIADGYLVHDTGPRSAGRLFRMLSGGYRMYRAVRAARPTIAHFHDPELIPWALLLSAQGTMVIYDAHEDLELQIKHKPYLPGWAKSVLSRVVPWFESFAMKRFSGNIVVVPDVLERKSGSNLIMVANFPLLSEFRSLHHATSTPVERKFAYVGAISRARGVLGMIEAMKYLPDEESRLVLMGSFDTEALETEARSLSSWERVAFLGWSCRETVVDELGRARAGLVLLHPTPQYVISYPVKMFEYMAAGLPVIASDFPLWRQIVESVGCGILVDPEDPKAISAAMTWILENPDRAQAMGHRGRQAVEDTYSWEPEGKKLVALYEELLG